MEEEKIRDAILERFRNDDFSWEQVRNKDFYESLNLNYYVIEKSINFLLADGALDIKYPKYVANVDPIEMISLSYKGSFVISDFKKYGYEAVAINENKKIKKEKKEKLTNLFIQLATLIITVLSLWITVCQLSKSDDKLKNRGNEHHHKNCNSTETNTCQHTER